MPGGLAAIGDAADMKLSRKLIQDAVDGTGIQPYTATNADRCPHCGARQSWYPVKEPKKTGGIGAYLLSVFVCFLLGVLVWAIFFFRSEPASYLCPIIGGGLGFLIVFLFRLKKKDASAKKYAENKREYDAFTESMKTRTVRNKPEILWETAWRNPSGV